MRRRTNERRKFARLVDFAQTPAGSRSNLNANVAVFFRSRCGMSDLNSNRNRMVRDSLNRATWSLIAVVVVIIVFVSLCVYGSSDGDRSSAVINASPQAELNR